MRLEALERALAGAATPGSRMGPDLEALLEGPGGLAPAAGLAVYANNLLGARVQALRRVYPVCEAVLGEALFRRLAAHWGRASASRTPDLNLEGEGFGPWLQGQVRARAAVAPLSYLGDLAALEWRWHAAWYAGDERAFDHAGFAALGARRAATVRLRVAGHLGLLRTPWPVRRIHALHRAGRAPASVAALPAPEHLCVWREQASIRVRAVPRPWYRVLRAARRGLGLESLARVCAGAGGDPGTVVPQLIARGWISGFSPGP